MRPVVKTLTGETAVTGSFAATQTTAGAGNLVLVSPAPTFANAVQVSLTSSVDQSLVNFTITGTDADGHPQSEILVGPNANTVGSVGYYLTVTSIYADAALATDIEAGNTDLTCTGTIVVDYINSISQIMERIKVSSGGSLTFGVDHTFDDVFDMNLAKEWVQVASGSASASISSFTSTAPFRGSRLYLTAFTSGSVTNTLIQGLEK